MRSASKRRRYTAPTLLLLQLVSLSTSFTLRPGTLSKLPSKTSNNGPCTSRVTHCKRRYTVSRLQHPISQLDSSPNDTTNQDDSSASNNSSSSSSPKRIIKKQKDLYAILNATPTMTKSEIKQRYISLAKLSHPDSPSYNASIDFSEITSAYKTLSDDKLRRRYDREVAAEEFKGDVVAYASEIAKEYGPVAKKLYEDWALPFLKRTTASTVAGWSAIGEVTGVENNASTTVEKTRTMGGRNGLSNSYNNGKSLSDVVKDQTVLEQRERNNGNRRALEDFGKAFQRVIEAGRNATRLIDGAELQEKSLELRQRADEARAESLLLLEQLSALKYERLRLTFHAPNADFSSAEALQFLEEIHTENNNQDETTNTGIMGRMGFKHTIREDIETYSLAEQDYEKKMQEKDDVYNQVAAMTRELEIAQQSTQQAESELAEAKQRLERAQLQLSQFQSRVSEVQRDITNMNLSVKRADQELTKSELHLGRKRDIVRRALKRKEEEVYGGEQQLPTFTSLDGRITLNQAFDKSAANTGGETNNNQYMAQIELLRKQEANAESEFLMLVEKASRLVSRSERLRLRSEALIGKQQDESVGATGNEYADGSNRGTVIGDIVGEIPM
ncbi:hypothetical protein ACHAXN_005613 [Cyclotella atomus]